MRKQLWVLTLGAFMSLGIGPLQAQTTEPALSSVVTLDLERLFRESAFGRGVLAEIEARQLAQLEENRLLKQSLEAEERDLTSRRAGMTAAAFAPLATAFDQKAEGVRKAQAEKERALGEAANRERQRFFDAATPVLRALMRDRGAQAIIDGRVIILDPSGIDITAEAVVRMDAEFPAAPKQ
jgi:Skp family chaperone for outer membrane proteins